MPEQVWTTARIRRMLLMRRYAYGKPPTQLADETGLPLARIDDVLAGRSFSDAVAARLVGYFETPAGPAALGANHDRRRAPTSRRWGTVRKVKMLSAIGHRFGWGPKLDETKVRNDGELMCYGYTVEDKLKRIILDHYPEARRKRLRFFDSRPVWKWLEFLEQSGGPLVKPRHRNGQPSGWSRPITR